MVSKPQVDIANNQDVLDLLNHGFEEASDIFFVATGGCDEAEPGEHGNNHGHLDDDGVDIGVYAEDFEVFGFDGHPRFNDGVTNGDGRKAHEEPEDEQHEEACLYNLPDHGDDDEVAPRCDFEGSVFVDFLFFDPVLGGVPDSAFEGYGALVVVFSLKLATSSPLLRPRRRAVRSREAVTTTKHGEYPHEPQNSPGTREAEPLQRVR